MNAIEYHGPPDRRQTFPLERAIQDVDTALRVNNSATLRALRTAFWGNADMTFQSFAIVLRRHGWEATQQVLRGEHPWIPRFMIGIRRGSIFSPAKAREAERAIDELVLLTQERVALRDRLADLQGARRDLLEDLDRQGFHDRTDEERARPYDRSRQRG